jgi:hypothetical protein
MSEVLVRCRGSLKYPSMAQSFVEAITGVKSAGTGVDFIWGPNLKGKVILALWGPGRKRSETNRIIDWAPL